MSRRILILSLLLLGGLAFLSVQAHLVDRVRNRLAYADLVPQRDNLDDPSRAAMLAEYDRLDPLVPAGATYIIGDSIAFRAPFAGPCIANRGIGGERSDQLLANLPRWPMLKRAGAVVIAVGTNDVWQWRSERLGANVRALIERIDAPTYVIGLVADIRGISEANEMLRRACAGDCTFIEPISARAEDGIHLTPAGYVQIAAFPPLSCKPIDSQGRDRLAGTTGRTRLPAKEKPATRR